MAGDPTITVRLEPGLEKALDQVVEKTGKSRSQLVREAIVALIGMYRNAEK